MVSYLDVVAMTDAIIALLDDPARRKDLGTRAQHHVRTHRVTSRAAPRLLQTLIEVEPRLAEYVDPLRPSPTDRPEGPR